MGAGDTSKEEFGTQPGAGDTPAEESGTGREDRWSRRWSQAQGNCRGRTAAALLGQGWCALSGPRRGECDVYICGCMTYGLGGYLLSRKVSRQLGIEML
jgi:hypothetical protein